MKKKRKFKLSIYGKIILSVLVVGLIIFLFTYPFFIKLNGDKEVYVEIYNDYQDAGAQGTFNQELMVESDVNTSALGTYKVSYSWFFECVTRTVKVVDTTPPEITLKGLPELYLPQGTDYVEEGYVCLDNYDGDITGKVEINNKIKRDIPGDYTIVYSVTDSNGNKQSVERIVHIVEQNEMFVNEVKNKEKISDEMLAIILTIENSHYRNLRYLSFEDTKYLFDSEEAYYLYKQITDMVIKIRRGSNVCLSISDVSLDIHIDEIQETIYGTRVRTYEYAKISYAYNKTNVAESEIYVSYLFNNDDKLIDYYREEGCYYTLMYDYDHYDNYKDRIDNMVNNYYQKYQSAHQEYMQDLEMLNNGEITYESLSDRFTSNSYNREKAANYAQKYWLEHNNQDYFFIIDNNCQNFASQCLHAGGIPMIDVGNNQWKCYDFAWNEDNIKYGFSSSWTVTDYFVEFAEACDSIVIETGLSPYFAQPGDVIMFGESHYNLAHATVASAIIKDQDGKVVDILYCANTNNVKNIPLSTSTSIYMESEKVIGYN